MGDGPAMFEYWSVGILVGNGMYPLVMTNGLLLKMAIEIVSFPINSMVIFNSYVKLPEGILYRYQWNLETNL